ncbi:hypothetical protein P168DRAFT_287931 [Aspergillus campestris IBT 28561]|uniref:Uncharacterized protein n=1 Tax=Aspergillus campestris (strain IBT 28561) TaxID=1392248 RepID=A0A2I1DC55_ASPC2|nr:uncharacterized protein P168DRAFT_287931 [Aspergillus campestris IBT 28561]PKY07451.1 hypothetical protein P168DRAFT_287931 [Aspergillus campestris IBT 28561]
MLGTAARHTSRSLTHNRHHLTRQPFSTRLLQRPQSAPRQALFQNIKTAQSTRPISQATHRWKRGFREASKGIWRKNPILLPLALFSLAGATALFTYVAYVEYTTVGPQYVRFPPPVADALRTGVYYTEVDINPPRALQAYKDALRMALEMGMHPYSDEVLGIKFQTAAMLEKAGLIKPAIEVLERVKREILEWVEMGHAIAGTGGGVFDVGLTGEDSKAFAARQQQQRRQQQQLQEPGKESKLEISGEASQNVEDLLKIEAHESALRDKAFKKAVGICMKLGELYASDYIQDAKAAEASQEAAVELCLKELQRRQHLGLPIGRSGRPTFSDMRQAAPANNADDDDSAADNDDDNHMDPWLNLTEIATALTQLADTYNEREQYELALPLYVRALEVLRMDERDEKTNKDYPSCRQAVLLNDIGGTLAHQAQRRAPTATAQAAIIKAFRTAKKDGETEDPDIAQRRALLARGIQFLHTARDVSQRVRPPLRDEECDLSCLFATLNLGELAGVQGRREEAFALFRETGEMAKKLGYPDVEKIAEEGMERAQRLE